MMQHGYRRNAGTSRLCGRECTCGGLGMVRVLRRAWWFESTTRHCETGQLPQPDTSRLGQLGRALLAPLLHRLTDSGFRVSGRVALRYELPVTSMPMPLRHILTPFR